MEPNLAGLAVKATERDGACWDDDSIEVFMRPDLERAAYRQLIVNAAGVRYDGAERDGAWNGAWSAVTGREDDAWTVEVAVPWQTLGCEAPAAGDRMGFEIVRTRPQSDEVLQWAPTADGNHSPEMFGILQFQDAE
jgi:hypothetical protein